jgi:hypothetical protein
MKKGLFFILALVFASLQLLAQNIVLTPHNNPVNGSIIDANTDLNTEISVENTSNESIDIMVSRQLVNGLPGTQNYFCWTACYTPSVSVSTAPITFAPSEIDENRFAVHYVPNEVIGSVTIKYCAYDNDNPADSSCVNVTFNALTVSTDEYLISDSFSDFYPNPAFSTAFLDYNLNSGDVAQVVVSDILGNVVLQQIIENQNGKLNFDLRDTKPGLYFANIFLNDDLKLIKRLVVSE